jgi:hypothetical protein
LTFEGKSALPFPAQTSAPAIQSDTGQLAWFHDSEKKGLVTIETDNTQALIGFVKHRAKALKNISAEINNDFCAILCTTLDGKPIAQSARLLLATGAKVANTGLKLDDERHTVAQWGKYPPAIEPVTGAVILRALEQAKSVEAQPLAAEGRPLESTVQATRSGDQWRIPIGEPATTWYLVKVNR